jgi:histidinol-phosphate aminotransferase
LGVALEDREYVDWYRRQVAESKQKLYAACDRFGLRYWRSEANFVLVRVGTTAEAKAVVEALAAKRIFVRDRSTQPGCEGCIRITTGLVDHTQACIAALEEVLCAEA